MKLQRFIENGSISKEMQLKAVGVTWSPVIACDAYNAYTIESPPAFLCGDVRLLKLDESISFLNNLF